VLCGNEPQYSSDFGISASIVSLNVREGREMRRTAASMKQGASQTAEKGDAPPWWFGEGLKIPHRRRNINLLRNVAEEIRLWFLLFYIIQCGALVNNTMELSPP
jgi:hypothetical protein